MWLHYPVFHLWLFFILISVFVQEYSTTDLVYCSNNANCLPFSYCRTLRINSEIQYCRWGSGEPYICCPKTHPTLECGVLSVEVLKSTYEHSMLETVVGGFPVQTAKSSPWMVAVGEQLKPQVYEWFCGAGLVTKNRALTAAHCVERRRADIVRLGELDFATSDDNAFPRDIYVVGAIKHPQYKPPSFYNDIAVLKLKDDVKFNDYIKPICLPKSNSKETYEGAIATLTGWGQIFDGKRRSVLQEVNVTVFENSNCSLSYTRPDVRHFHYPSGIISSQLCAGDPNGGRDACQGDSGGPLVVANNSIHVLIGIISSGARCGSKTFPGVYTRVSSFLEWINEYI